MAETSSLLNCRTREGVGGSNPPPSAKSSEPVSTERWVKEHVASGCPLSFLLAYADSEMRREPSTIGKAFWNAVLEQLARV